MSEEADEQGSAAADRKKARAIDPRMLERFMGVRRATAHCLRCASTTWQVAQGQFVAALSQPDGTARQVSYFALACDNCGDMWFISPSVFHNWLDEQEGLASGDG